MSNPILPKVRDLLSNPKAWTQDAWARDVNGIAVGPVSDKATCWCLEGAINKAINQIVKEGKILIPWYSKREAEGAIMNSMDTYRSIPSFNDDEATTHTDILRVLDKAIESCSTTV